MNNQWAWTAGRTGGWVSFGFMVMLLVSVAGRSAGIDETFCRVAPDSILICDNESMDDLWFVLQLPFQVTALYINHTAITVLKNYTFQEAGGLTELVIRDNPLLRTIEADAFFGLTNLISLKMENNFLFRSIGDSDFLARDFFRFIFPLPNIRNVSLSHSHLNLTGVSSRSPFKVRLELLDLSHNPLENIGPDFFCHSGQDRNLSVTNLVLRNTNLSSIDPDVFSCLDGLQRVDLGQNAELFYDPEMKQSLIRALAGLPDKSPLTHLRLDQNGLHDVPVELLAVVNSSIRTLDLSKNPLSALGIPNPDNTFPRMPSLQMLILDECDLTFIEPDVFSSMTNLEHLQIRKNPLMEIPGSLFRNLPNLKLLSIDGDPDSCEQQRNYDPGSEFRLGDHGFSSASQLEELHLICMNLGILTRETFSGLTGLRVLRLDHSYIRHIEPDTLYSMPRLENLHMANCSGLTSISLDTLMGPEKLEVIDVTNIKIVPDFSMNSTPKNPFAHTKVLKLTGSLQNIAQPMKYLRLPEIPHLEVLELGQNGVDFWNQRKLTNNTKLRSLVLSHNRKVMTLTPAMIEDFSALSYLDLSHNQFICNNVIVKFFVMAGHIRNDSRLPQVVDWDNGNGYSCQTLDGNSYTFRKFTEMGDEIDSGYIYVYSKGGLLASLLSLCFCGMVISVAGYLAHQHWWYIKYKWARAQIRRRGFNNNKNNNVFAFDVFISYSSQDEAWVQQVLIQRLDDSPFKLCLHDRDFEIGRSITENVVASLEKSRTCLLVLSKSYLNSSWCNFEAQVAQIMMQERGTPEQLVLVLIEPRLPEAKMTAILKAILKTRTYLPFMADQEEQFALRLRLKLA